MTFSDPDVAAWTRGRETRGIAVLLAFMTVERQPVYLFLRPALRHRSEQYRTSSQLRRHFLRQVKGLPHTGQTLDGSWPFLGNLGISALGP
mgnify:FL=1